MSKQLVFTTDEELGPIVSYGSPRVGPSSEDAFLLISKRVDQEVMRSKNPKPSSKFVVSSSSEESSSSDRTMDDSEVIGTVTVDKPAVSSGRDVGLTLVKPDGKMDHYQVPSLDKWKGNMGIRDDIDISYYNRTGAEVVEDGFICYLNQVVYGLSIPLTFFQKDVMNALKSCPGQLNGNVFEMMKVCEALSKRWRDGGIARQFEGDDVLKYYKFKYVKDRKSGYLFSDSARPKFFDFESVGRPWCDHHMMVREPNPKGAADTLSLLDVVRREGTGLNKVLGALGIRKEKRLNSIVEKVQQAHQNRAMATFGSAYDDIMEIPAYAASTSSSLLSVAWKSAAEVLKVAAADRVEYEAEKREQFEKEKALQKDQIEKEAAATKKEVEDEKKKVVDIVVVSQNKLIQAFYFRGLSREDVNLALIGKYIEIIFPGDDASPVAEESPAPPVADDTSKELQCRYGKIKIERDEVLRKESDRFALLQKSLKDKRFVDESDKLECQRSLLSLTLYFEAKDNSEWGLKEAYLELLTERGIALNPARVKILAQEVHNRHSIEAQRCSARAGVSIIWGGVENDKVENMWFAKGNEGGGASTSKPRAEESVEEEIEDLLPHTRHKTRPQEVVISNEPLQVDAKDNEQDKLAALSASNKELSAKLRQCPLAAENMTLLNSKLESEMLELQSRLNVVTVELSCKDAEILTANNEAELRKEFLKKKKLETMAANQQVLDLLSTIEKQKNDLLYHQSVVTNNTDLLKKQDAEIYHMRERLKKVNWDLRDVRDSCHRKSNCAKTHEEACSKRDREMNEAINKCNSRIADLVWDKQALILEYMRGSEVYEEL
ncbi:hypothetical protein GIB67_017499 [Kingdonia uniflora]|uniref:Uncharacterized protein n=1 Tax=Kingdonia uniflora TaxID=39325 RepID=A0A7J7M4I5_9MAGN|nr:hypothetical protein GIB67_017499 [Kingdonia uniflora]